MRRGFTLLELLIVVIIIGILASVAIPGYIRATERAKLAKAERALGLIAEAEKMYRGENDLYINCATPGMGAVIGMYVELDEIDADPDWGYAVAGAAADVFTATATRTAGPFVGGTVTLDQAGVWGGTFRGML